MRLLICALSLLIGCSPGGDDVSLSPLLEEVGSLENGKLDEVSGLARSNRVDDLFWAINDDGPAAIHAVNAGGRNLGTVEIANAKNRDWEDLASFVLDDRAYLVIADIGDNKSKHKHLNLYVVEEPDPQDNEAELAWQISFHYPDGPRDAEALAVDATGKRIYVLSKRTIPAVLYQVPLRPTGNEVVVATRFAEIDSLPQPSNRDAHEVSGSGWYWQPTGMDFAADGSSALILTYAGVNYFSRSANQTWPEALQGQAMQLKLGKYKHAEAITYSSDGSAAIVTVEKKHAPVLKIDLRSVNAQKKASPKAGL